jgi:hypothetical protein
MPHTLPDKIFGKKVKLKEGDLVWWTDIENIGKKNYGIIKSFEKVARGGRFVWMAKVFFIEKSEFVTILASILHKSNKNKGSIRVSNDEMQDNE